MRKSILSSFLAVVIIGILTASCSGIRELYPSLPDSEIVLPDSQTDSITFAAYLGEDSRTQLGEGMAVHWSTGDKVKVFTAAVPQGVEFELIAGEGTSKGVFVGPAPGVGPYYAVYPSQVAVGMTGSALAIDIPATQSYAVDSFGPGASISAGMADRLDGIHFHNMGGVLQLSLSGDKTITGIRVCSYDEEPLFGTAVIDGWEKTVPSMALDAGQTGESYREIYLDCGKGVALSSGGTAFFLSVPPGTLGGGYRIEVYDSEGLAMVKYAKAQNNNRVDRSEVVQMPSVAFVPHYKKEFLLAKTIGAFANAGAEGELVTSCTYVEGKSQYAYLNSTGENGTRYLRLEDWDEGFAIGLSMPYTLTPGKNCPVTIKSLGLPSISSGKVEKMQVIKVSEGKVWMVDPDSGNGFILMLVEE